ncbi:hypothetical protein C8R44DRAFT_754788 [Mycena epipterygia]|nr:hypothetical protein C8R44DRAFT_754788 [Mycena epipterygia]
MLFSKRKRTHLLNLGPQELYNLSQTNKSIRAFLTSRSNAGPIWRHAFGEAVADGDFPPPSPYIKCELQWAQLICFSEFDYPIPVVNVWVQTRLPKELQRCLPRHDWWDLFPCAPENLSYPRVYSSREIKSFTKEYFSVKTIEDREDCVRRQRARTEAINKPADACEAWQARIPWVPDRTSDGRRRDANIRETTSRSEEYVCEDYDTLAVVQKHTSSEQLLNDYDHCRTHRYIKGNSPYTR